MRRRWPKSPSKNKLSKFIEVKATRSFAGPKPRRAEVRRDLAVCLSLIHTGKLDEATREFHKVMELNPAAGKPHHDLGIAYPFQGKIAEATEGLTKNLAQEY